MRKIVITVIVVLSLFYIQKSQAARNYYVDNSGNVHATSFTGDGSSLTDISNLAPDIAIDGDTDQNGVRLRWTENNTNNGLTICNDYGREQIVFKLTSHIGNQLVIGTDVDQDFDHSAPTNPTLFIHSATAPDTNNTYYLSLYHCGLSDATYLGHNGAVLTTGYGGIVLAPNTGLVTVQHSTTSTNPLLHLHSEGTANNSAIVNAGEDGAGSAWPAQTIAVDYGFDQSRFAIGEYCGRQVIICDQYTGNTRDFGHAEQTNPTVFIHSATDPNLGDTTQWLSLHHDQTDSVIQTGKGGIAFHDPNSVERLKIDNDGTIIVSNTTSIGLSALSGRITFSDSTPDRINILSCNVGIGIQAPASKLHVDHSDPNGAIPVLTLDQADVDQDMVKFIGTSTTDATQTLVDAADLSEPGSVVGWIKVYVQDDAASGAITDGVYYIPFYSAPSAP